MSSALQMRQQRGDLGKKAQAILTKAETEKRSMNTEEQAEFDNLMNEVDRMGTEIETIEKMDGARSRLASFNTSLTASAGRYAEGVKPTTGNAGKPSKEERKQARAEKRAARCAEDSEYRRSRKEYRAAFDKFVRYGSKTWGPAEFRALQADADIVGGYLVPPIQFVNKIILFLKDFVFVRKLATIVPVANAQSLGVPSLDADPSDANWTVELATGNQDATMAFGRRDLSPHPVAKQVLVSNKLLRLAPNTEALLRDRLGYKFAITEEKAFLNGSGSQQPLGVFTASSFGIDTSRDVNTSNTTTNVTADNLIECKYTLKAQYQMSKTTAWIFHRTTVKQIRKLKDANGQYLWAPGLASSEPDTVLDVPFYMSEYAPNTYTTGQYVGVIGDWRFYWIADSLNFAIQRLDELYAATNQTGFIARREVDGMPVLAEAFVRCKLA